MAVQSRQTRRKFLQQAAAGGAAALVVPYFVPSTVLGQGVTPPSDRIVMGVIGTGGMGRGNCGAFMGEPDVQMIAVCDVDAGHRLEAAKMVNEKYGNGDCQKFGDFRELLTVPGIDAVVVATPDHWHALASIAALNAGKDVYCEKPLANSVGEGRAICDAVAKNRRILQCGSHERSNPKVREAAEFVRNGRLGTLKAVHVMLPCDEAHHNRVRAVKGVPPAEPVPEGLDYEFWLGHAPKAPYTPMRCHFHWRFILSYGGGEMTDRGAHIIDIGQLALDADDTGPVSYAAKGASTPGSLFNAYFDFEFENTYAGGVKMLGTSKPGPRGIKFEGDQGTLMVNVHGGDYQAEPATLLEPIEDGEVHLGRTPSHRRNFLDCVKSREQPFATAEIGHRTATICHLNNIAMRLGKSFTWDPVKEQTDDDEANALLTPTMRRPWTL